MLLGRVVAGLQVGGLNMLCFVLCLMTCARFAAAAMRASARDMDGLVRYLCLKNTVSEMQVVRVSVDQIFQHL